MIVLGHLSQLLPAFSRIMKYWSIVYTRKKGTIFESFRNSYLAQVLGKDSTQLPSIFFFPWGTILSKFVHINLSRSSFISGEVSCQNQDKTTSRNNFSVQNSKRDNAKLVLISIYILILYTVGFVNWPACFLYVLFVLAKFVVKHLVHKDEGLYGRGKDSKPAGKENVKIVKTHSKGKKSIVKKVITFFCKQKHV